VSKKVQFRRGRISDAILGQIRDALSSGESIEAAISKHPDKNGLVFNVESVKAALDGKKLAKTVVLPKTNLVRRGRPAGSRNKVKRGRPKGKNANLMVVQKMGRPKSVGGLAEIEAIVARVVSARLSVARDSAIQAIATVLS
jgi:hypothetical protein